MQTSIKFRVKRRKLSKSSTGAAGKPKLNLQSSLEPRAFVYWHSPKVQLKREGLGESSLWGGWDDGAYRDEQALLSQLA